MHGLSHEPLALRLARIDFGLLHAVPAEDRHELMRRRAVLGCDRGAGLAQTMGGALRQAGSLQPRQIPTTKIASSPVVGT
jgi:hypothetical protein